MHAAIWQGFVMLALLAAPLCALTMLLPRRWRLSERVLGAGVLLPLVVLVELFVADLSSGDGALQLAVRVMHGLVAAALVLVIIARRQATRLDAARLRRACGRVWSGQSVAERCATAAAIVMVLTAFLYGVWNTVDEHDGGWYRIVVVMQPVHDGHIGPVRFFDPNFADAYPRTVELALTWTVLVSGDGAGLHVVNWLALLLLGLATYVAAGWCGLARRQCMLAAVFVLLTPLPLYMTGVLYNDLPAAALTASCFAMALGAARRPNDAAKVWLLAAAAALAASTKATSAIGVGVVIAVLLVWLVAESRRRRDIGALVRLAPPLALAAALGAIPYVRAWIVYGSPLYPVEVTAAGLTIFEGPLSGEALQVTAKGGWAERWGAKVFKLFQTMSQDANGGFGPLFAVMMLPAGLIMGVVGLARRQWIIAFAFVCFAYAALVPPASSLRYSMHILAPGAVLLVLALQRIERTRLRRGLVAAAAALAVAGAVDYARAIAKEMSDQLRSGVSLWSADRNRAWYVDLETPPDFDKVRAATRRAVCDELGRDGSMAYSVYTLAGQFYDAALKRRIECVPPGEGWREAIEAGGFNLVLVNAAAEEARVLPSLGYDVRFEQPAADGYPALIVFGRSSGAAGVRGGPG